MHVQGKQGEGTEAEATNLVHLKAHATAKKPAPARSPAPYALLSAACIIILALGAGVAWLFLSEFPSQRMQGIPRCPLHAGQRKDAAHAMSPQDAGKRLEHAACLQGQERMMAGGRRPHASRQQRSSCWSAMLTWRASSATPSTLHLRLLSVCLTW
jgi:hypothetical protein